MAFKRWYPTPRAFRRSHSRGLGRTNSMTDIVDIPELYESGHRYGGRPHGCDEGDPDVIRSCSCWPNAGSESRSATPGSCVEKQTLDVATSTWTIGHNRLIDGGSAVISSLANS